MQLAPDPLRHFDTSTGLPALGRPACGKAGSVSAVSSGRTQPTINHYLFPINYCLFPINYCLFPINYCLFPINYCLFPINY